jgi:hypothetical protein
MGPDAPEPQVFDRVLVAVGRTANGNTLNAAAAGVEVDRRGIIAVNKQMRTNMPHIFAIGDVVGPPMLAHKASHEAKVAAEVAAGQKSAFDARCIPSVAYTDPEIAWVGINEIDAKARGIEYGKGLFPWAASGRSLALNRDEGFTKILFDKQTHRVIGAGIVGTNAGELMAELGLAIEMGADAADVGLTIHPHPTLSETVAFAAEAFEGTLTDLYIPKRKLPARHRSFFFAPRGGAAVPPSPTTIRGFQMGREQGRALFARLRLSRAGNDAKSAPASCRIGFTNCGFGSRPRGIFRTSGPEMHRHCGTGGVANQAPEAIALQSTCRSG